MTDRQIINELDSIISYCDVTKEKAAALRKKLKPVTVRKKKISDEEVARVLAARRNFKNKKALSR